MRKTSTDTLLKTSKNKDTEKTRELTTDELNHVSGGKGKYMEVKLKEMNISGVQS